ncbi:MAG: HD domain-containing protein, partial [Parcubacteria group bacterium]|nr:HD domain-containing protein [Parcubacteria group bacterium]
MEKKIITKIPKEVSHVTRTLEKAGFEAYLVGGCVRDLIMEKDPKDWDIATNAKPEQIISLFKKTVYENKFGTVLVIQEDVSCETLRQIEVTPYRIEAKYSDFRHPDEVKFTDNLEDDLKRRDFTINAMALSPKGHLVDLFNGIKDIKDKMLKAVGEPDDRFTEDALRMLRAIRFACQLGFSVSYETTESIIKNADLIKKISKERIQDEFIKILLSPNPATGIVMLQKFGLLKNIIPELEEGIGCEQSGEHIYDVWEHSLQALQHAANKNWSLEIRLAALFHDIGKPRSRRSVLPKYILRHSHSALEGKTNSGLRKDPSKNILAGRKAYTFYGHEVVSARIAKKIMERLKFSKKETELVEKLILNHMFFSDTEIITLSAVRRIIAKVGKENIWSLMRVRECDRVGMKKKEA